MLLSGYTREIFRPECNPSFQSVHCVAHLKEDVSRVLPYLNTVLGGSLFIQDPPSVTFRAHGKLITVHAREIFVNALVDEVEADRILQWLAKEINDAWDQRGDIEPCFEGKPVPRMIDVLRLLPKTNCTQCREPTCTVFALRACEGVKTADDCPALDARGREALAAHLSRFEFDV